MTKTINLPERKSLRLKGYDYSSEGMYFVTICTHGRNCMLGELAVGAGPSAGPKIVLNEIGSMVESIWKRIPDFYTGTSIDEFVIMPNHFHGIIGLIPFGRPQGAAPTLSDIIHRFKSLTTNRYHKRSVGKLWQCGYHDQIIRNDDELSKIRQYIQDNPAKWSEDPENVNP